MAGESPLAPPPWKQGEDAALALRYKLRLGDSPVNVWDVIRKTGVLLALHDLGEDGSDGLYLSKGSRQLILVNSHPSRRVSKQRFTAAHELGHHEMHRHVKGGVLIDDPDVFQRTKDPREVAANAFAGNLLAPASALADALGTKPAKDVTPEDVVRLMGTFGLSYEATCNRLRGADIINTPQRKHLVDAGKGNVEAMLQQAGIHEDAMFPPGRALPGEYVEQVETLWKHRHITDARFAEMLRLEGEDQPGAWITERGLTRAGIPEAADPEAAALLEELS